MTSEGTPGNIRAADERAAKINAELTATDQRFRGAVALSLDDGTHLFMENAFAVHWKEYVFVFAEHQRPMVFHWADVNALRCYRQAVPVEEVE